MPLDVLPESTATSGLTDAELRASAVTVTGAGGSFPVTDSGGTLSVDDGGGSITVDASSLPLPTGAATAAKQPALGTAGTASADVITVQGIASMTALKVDGSAVTQPVSFSGDVTVVGKAAHNAAASGNPVLVAGIYEAAGAGLDDGDACALRVTSSGAMTVHVSNVVPVSGEVLIQDAVTEDEASGGGESLVLAGAIRRDTATSGAGTDGDYTTLSTDASGRLWTASVPRKFPVALVTRTGVTTSYTSATLDTPYGRGVQLVVNVSSAPGAQTISVNLYSITSTFGVPVLTAANVINNTGSFFVELYPGVTEVAATAGPAIVNRRVSGALADQFLVNLAHSGAGSWTYTVQYCLIP